MSLRSLIVLVVLAVAGAALPGLSVPVTDIEEAETSVVGIDSVVVKAILAAEKRPDAPPSETRSSSDRRPLAILLHGYARDRDTLLPLADALVESGFVTLRPDLRGHGESIRRADGEAHVAALVGAEDFRRSSVDMRRFLEALRKDRRIDTTRIVVVGVGLSGFIAAEVAALEPDVAGVAMIDPPAVQGDFEPGRELATLDLRPALFTVSALPGAEEQANALARYGDGARIVKRYDSYDGGDKMLVPGTAPVTELASWALETVSAGRAAN